MTSVRPPVRSLAVAGLTAALVLVAPMAAHADVYWTNTGGGTDSVGRAHDDGRGPDQGFVPVAAPESPLAVHGGYLYWASSTTTLGRVPVDGSAPAQTDFVTGLVSPAHGIAVDDDFIYWSEYGDWASGDGRAIRRLPTSTGGAAPDPLVIPDGSPNGVLLAGGHLYWTNSGGGWGGAESIARADLDGGNADQGFLTAGVENAVGLAAGGGRIFWSNFSGAVMAATLADAGPAGVPAVFLAADVVGGPLGLAADADHLYWATFNNPPNTVGRAALDGTGVDPAFIAGAEIPDSKVYGVAVDAAQPLPTLTQVAPSSGPAAGATSVTLTGTGFVTGVTTVTVAGRPCVDLAVVDDTTLTCLTPAAAAAGAADVTVTNAVSRTATMAGGFTYEAAPLVDQVPLAGCVVVPAGLRLRGTTVVLKPHCLTTAGRRVRVTVAGRSATADSRLFRLHHNASGALVIRTYGHHVRVRITWWAPATATAREYLRTARYRR